MAITRCFSAAAQGSLRGKVRHKYNSHPIPLSLFCCFAQILWRGQLGEDQSAQEAHHLPLCFLCNNPTRVFSVWGLTLASACTHQGAGNGFLWFLGAQLFHGIVVLLLFFGHEDVLASKVKEERREGTITIGSLMLWLGPTVQSYELRVALPSYLSGGQFS